MAFLASMEFMLGGGRLVPWPMAFLPVAAGVHLVKVGSTLARKAHLLGLNVLSVMWLLALLPPLVDDGDGILVDTMGSLPRGLLGAVAATLMMATRGAVGVPLAGVLVWIVKGSYHYLNG